MAGGSKTPKKPPWYVSGLAFECVNCGRCCAGPEEGYVWITDAEIAAIAEHLGIPADQVRIKYCRRVRKRWSLIEEPENNDCVFLAQQPDGSNACQIYPVRPMQCRTWPFWPANLASAHTWAEAQKRCMGINRGRLWFWEEIEAMHNATIE